MDILLRIKRSVLSGNVVFTDKATTERERDGLTEQDVVESIVIAVAIYKKIKSTIPPTAVVSICTLFRALIFRDAWSIPRENLLSKAQ